MRPRTLKYLGLKNWLDTATTATSYSINSDGGGGEHSADKMKDLSAADRI